MTATSSKYLLRLVAIILAGFVASCTSLLPHGEKKAISQWETFDDAMAAYEKVIPYSTHTSELAQLGFSPKKDPNIRILNHADILYRLYSGPGRQEQTLPKGLRECLSAGDQCSGYEIKLRVTQDQRYGNFLVDMFNFKRKVETRGWEFNVVLVLIDDLVVYKTWSGTPEIHEYSDTTNPLGPLQSIGPALIPGPNL